MEVHGLAEGLILTEEESGEETMGDKKINIMPIYVWLGMNGKKTGK
jgi:hypothetical protein